MKRTIFQLGALLIVFALTFAVSCQRRELQLETQTKTFQQQVSESVDILFVVDNSESLVEEVAKVRDGITSFVSALVNSNADFQLGVVTMNVRSQVNTGLPGDDQSGLLQIAPTVTTTDPDTRPFLVSSSDVDPDDLIADLQATFDYIETDPSKTDDVLGKGCEAGLEAARLAIDGSINQNPEFLRENTNLAIIFISDEDDTSITLPDAIAEADDNCNDFEEPFITTFPKIHDTVEDYLSFFQAIVGNFLINAVGTLDGDIGSADCADVDPAEVSSVMIDLAAQTEGSISSICEDDYSDFLDELGVTIASLGRTFELDFPALPNSIAVRVDGTAVSSDQVSLSEDQTVVTLGFTPGFGSTVEVDYLVDTEAANLTLVN